MSFYDIVILVVLFGSMFYGYTKGLAWQIASVAAVVVSYIAAVRFRGQVAQYVSADPPFNNIAAMLIIFVVSSLVIWLAYAYVNKSIEKAELDGFNRQIGALVGAVLGVLLVMVITLFSVSLLGDSVHDSIFQSKLGPYVIRGISMAQAFVPEEFEARLDPHFENFYEKLGQDANQLTGAPGGSLYPSGQTVTPNSPRSFQGNWTIPSVQQPQEPSYQNSGYQNNGFQNNGYQPPNQTQTYLPPPNNQGTNYAPQQQQPQSSGLPPVEIKLDTETLLNGAGQLFQNFSNPNGN